MSRNQEAPGQDNVVLQPLEFYDHSLLLVLQLDPLDADGNIIVQVVDSAPRTLTAEEREELHTIVLSMNGTSSRTYLTL